MRHNALGRILLFGTLGTFIPLLALPAQAATIRDDAGFFGEKSLEKAEAHLTRLQKETGEEVRIETFATARGGKADAVAKMDKAERGRFFDEWARERATAERVKGLYVLICKKPGHVQVEVDRRTRDRGFGATERSELRDRFLSGFRHKDYDKALLDGVDYIDQTMKSLKVRAGGAGIPVAAHRRENADRGNGVPHARGMGWLGWIIVAVVVFLAIRLIMGLFSGMMGAGRPAGGFGGGYGPGPGPGYGGFGGGGGGGMFGSLMSGLFGAVAGNWLYHNFFGSTEHGAPSSMFGGGAGGADRDSDDGAGEDFQGTGGDFDDDDRASGGGDFDADDSGGGDFGGGDFGGGDFGGGDFGGGDFGGGDSGGGDF